MLVVGWRMVGQEAVGKADHCNYKFSMRKASGLYKYNVRALEGVIGDTGYRQLKKKDMRYCSGKFDTLSALKSIL